MCRSKALVSCPTLNWKVPPTKMPERFVSYSVDCERVKIHSKFSADMIRMGGGVDLC